MQHQVSLSNCIELMHFSDYCIALVLLQGLIAVIRWCCQDKVHPMPYLWFPQTFSIVVPTLPFNCKLLWLLEWIQETWAMWVVQWLCITLLTREPKLNSCSKEVTCSAYMSGSNGMSNDTFSLYKKGWTVCVKTVLFIFEYVNKQPVSHIWLTSEFL